MLSTPRLRLEPLTPEHAEELFEGLCDDRLYEFIDNRAPLSLEALRSRYEILAGGKSPDGGEDWLNWAVWASREARYVGFVQATVRQTRSAEIAYLLFWDSWGKGYAREAVAAMIAHLGECHEVTRFTAHVDTRNHRSAALLVGLGFTEVARRAATKPIHGRLADESEYALVAC